jgi:hypothetical protein
MPPASSIRLPTMAASLMSWRFFAA